MVFENLILFAVISFVGVVFWKVATDDKFAERVIRWENEMRGVETKITPATLKWRKLAAKAGLVMAVVGMFMVLTQALLKIFF